MIYSNLQLQLYAAQQTKPLNIDHTYFAKAYLCQEKENDTSKKQFTFESETNYNLNHLIIWTALLIVAILLAIIIIIAVIVINSKHKDWDKEIRKRIPLVFSLAVMSPIMCIYMLSVSFCSVGFWDHTYKDHSLYKFGIPRNVGPIVITVLLDLFSSIYCIAIIIGVLCGWCCSCSSPNKKGNNSRTEYELNPRLNKRQDTSNSENANTENESETTLNRENSAPKPQNTTPNPNPQNAAPNPNPQNAALNPNPQNATPNPNPQNATPNSNLLNATPNVNPQNAVSNLENASPHSQNNSSINSRGKWYVVLSLIILGPILGITAHSPYIAIAYLNDGYHAGSIFIYYIIVICLGLNICWMSFYSLRVKVNSLELSCDDERYTISSIVLGMVSAFIFLGLVVVVTVYFVIIPINKSISDAPNRLVGIYQSGGFLIASFVTYKLIASNKGSSIDNAIAKRKKPLKQGEDQATWDNKSSEDKIDDFYEVVVQIISTKAQKIPPPPPPTTN